MIRTIIVDDEYLIRYAIRNAVDWNGLGYEIVGEAENGEDALKKIRLLQPDLVLLDINLPMMDGIQVCRQLQDQQLEAAVIILTGYNDFKSIQQCLRLGVLDYVVKPIEEKELTAALENAREQIRARKSLRFRSCLRGDADTEDAAKEALNQKFYPGPEVFSPKSSRTQYNSSFSISQSHLQNLLLKAQGDEFMAYVEKTLSEAAALQISRERFVLICAVIVNTLWDFAASMNVEIDAAFKDQFNIAAYASRYETADEIKRELLLTSAHILSQFSKKCQMKPLIREAIDHIRDHYADPSLSSGSIAKSLAVSPNHLSKLFRQELGMTLTEYLTEVRISEAVALIEESGSISISRLAASVGYNDSFYFSKIFRKQKGVSPSEYVKLMRQGRK